MDTSKITLSPKTTAMMKTAIAATEGSNTKWKDTAGFICADVGMENAEGFIKSITCAEYIVKCLPAKFQTALAFTKEEMKDKPEADKAIRKEGQQKIGHYKAMLLRYTPKEDATTEQSKADHVANALKNIAAAQRNIAKATKDGGNFAEVVMYLAMCAGNLAGVKPVMPKAPETAK